MCNACGEGTGSVFVFAPGTFIRRQREEVESYNSPVRAPPLLEHTDVTFMLDNEAMYDVAAVIWVWSRGLLLERSSVDNGKSEAAQLSCACTPLLEHPP